MAVADSSSGDIVVATPPPPGKSPVVQAVDGDGVFQSPGGKTCHQCRQTIKNSAAVCTNHKKNKPCLIKVCDRCLLNRYGEKAEVIAVLAEWKCPKCRGICNCSVCRKKIGHQPTGPILNAAKANGFSSVSEFLDKEAAMVDSLIKENSTDCKVVADVPDSVENTSKMAVNGIAGDSVSSKKRKNGQKRQIKEGSHPCEKKPKKTKGGEMGNAEPHPEITALPVGTVLTNVGGIDLRSEDIGDALQFLEFCSVFGKVLEIRKGQPEHVLQDLFHGRTARRGKYSMTVQFHMQLLSVLKPDGIRESESSDAENPLHERNSWFQTLKECLTRKRQKFLKMLPVLDSLKNAADYDTLNPLEKLRVLNHLCDEILQIEKVRCWIDPDSKDAAKFKEAELQAMQESSSTKKTKKGTKKENIPQDGNSVQNPEQAIQECSLKKAKNGSEEASIPKDGDSVQNSEQAIQESSLKKKAENGIKENNIPEDGDSLQNFVPVEGSSDKSDAAQDHAVVPESKDMPLNSMSTFFCNKTDPVFVDYRGHAFWKLNCLGKSDILDQYIGEGCDCVTVNENWSLLDAEGKDVIEKHISSLQNNRKEIEKLRRKMKRLAQGGV